MIRRAKPPAEATPKRVSGGPQQLEYSELRPVLAGRTYLLGDAYLAAAAPTGQYVAQVREILKVTDGDTFWAWVDPGYRTRVLIDGRLLGFDTPEQRKGSVFERTQARVATGLTEAFLTQPKGQLWVRSEPDPDDFGRWLVEVWDETPDGTRVYLGESLRAAKLASVWPRRWRDEFDVKAPAARAARRPLRRHRRL